MSGTIADMKSQHWNTPDNILELTRTVFGGTIDLDPCDNEFSTTCPLVSWKLPEHDGLATPWPDVAQTLGRRINIFCNPPFGRSPDGTSIADWVKAAYTAGTDTERVANLILLIPASTETVFWHEFIWGMADAICFVKGRVRFPLEGKKGGFSPKGTALVYWGDSPALFEEVFFDLGRVVRQ